MTIFFLRLDIWIIIWNHVFVWNFKYLSIEGIRIHWNIYAKRRCEYINDIKYCGCMYRFDSNIPYEEDMMNMGQKDVYDIFF